MPASNTSIWSSIFSWLRRTPTASVPPTPPSTPPVTPPVPPTSPVRPPVTPVPPVAVPVPPTQPPVLHQDELPTEGPNLGFRRIWHNHPTISDNEVFPCRDDAGVPHFDNQCAILMGTCLLRSELLHGYDKPTCWYRGHKGHTLRAREVSDWMRRHPERFGRVEVRSNVSWGAFKGRTGFICFHNFWGAGNQGDHIDLWDGTGIVRRETDPTLEGAGLADGSLDYFERSEEVWFWPIH
ncbi:MAG: T6SS effector amidase Tae4 family protein [Thiothrix sp.]|uniref:T6SS effector amidase Tae4 family protein n=1 Tax=Thiothrix sp. TaxID=1032 RepID=UPI00260D1BEC|nr:T6SS effector amidase Tae4 family protein [Thiothrix sp.]MDD5393456.1 T6SS effector amidase Tae4 family protein [Thiothrix sp.]